MSEHSYENVEDENKNVTMREVGEEEVVIDNTGGQYQEDEHAPPPKPPKVRQHMLYQDDAGSDGEWVKQVITNLLLWRYPVHSALWLIIFGLVFFLVRFSEYSVLTLVCYTILLQLLATTMAIKAAPVLKSMNLLRASFDPKTFALQRQAFSAEELFRFSRGCAELASFWILEWNDTLETRNARKVVQAAGGLFVTALFGLVIPLDIALFICVLVAFTVFKIYELQQDRIDEVLAVVRERYDGKVAPKLEWLWPVLDSVLYRLEPVIGRFDN